MIAVGKSRATAKLCLMKNKMKKDIAFVVFANGKFLVTEKRESDHAIRIDFINSMNRRINNIDVDDFIDSIASNI